MAKNFQMPLEKMHIPRTYSICNSFEKGKNSNPESGKVWGGQADGTGSNFSLKVFGIFRIEVPAFHE